MTDLLRRDWMISLAAGMGVRERGNGSRPGHPSGSLAGTGKRIAFGTGKRIGGGNAGGRAAEGAAAECEAGTFRLIRWRNRRDGQADRDPGRASGSTDRHRFLDREPGAHAA
ncbi:hypothetical protein [Nannocystis pusilla]|uniref:hypothetical protein n=1 Tax=Nannocystis pusilla TaxID=889268 RepID=UPI003DA1CB87